VPLIRTWTLRGAVRGQLSALRHELKANRIEIVHLVYPDPYLRYRSDSYHLPFLLKPAVRLPMVVTFFGFGITGASLVTKVGLLSLFAAADRVVITDADLLRLFRRRLPWWRGKSRGGLVGSISTGDAPRWSWPELTERKLAVGLRPEDRHIGFFGFWSPDKGLDNLLGAVVRLRQSGQNVKLVLIGGRAPDERVESERAVISLARQLGITDSVIETGTLAPSQVSQYMVAMDVCALPFKVNPLGRSSLALALQLGVPTVVTRPPGEDASLLAGLALLDPPDPEHIAGAIAALLTNASEQQATAEAAVRAARYWSWDAIVDDYETLYEDMIGSRQGR
jgi:glycosyltransferase involved in cell wall biosynthesis